jgi:tetraacyldisaccharide 4'-kinase
MRPPAFWRAGGVPPFPLVALSWLYADATARRVARPGWAAGVPVICCGNPGAGGSGKTPLALDIAARLQARGHIPAFLTRGHGGSLRGPLRVDSATHSAQVGDEALLLAARSPTYIGADRGASARLAIADGASVLVLDDGLQNPSLAKTLSVMVIDGGAGFGNSHVIPAGPLREPVAAAAARCQAAVLIGADDTGAAAMLGSLEVLHARVVPKPDDLAVLPDVIMAFAGIGRPQKFFDTLREAGHAPVEALEFADHHPYTTAELDRLQRDAQARGAGLVTTAKDLMRIPPSRRGAFQCVRIRLEWSDPTAIEALLDRAMRR